MLSLDHPVRHIAILVLIVNICFYHCQIKDQCICALQVRKWHYGYVCGENFLPLQKTLADAIIRPTPQIPSDSDTSSTVNRVDLIL